jgi:predicted ATPase
MYQFYRILELADSFDDLIDKEINEIDKNLLREKIFEIHSLFTSIEGEVSARKLISMNIGVKNIIYEFSKKLYLDDEEYKNYSRLNNFRTYIWLNLFKKKTKELQIIVESLMTERYNENSYDRVLSDINIIYRQIQVVYKVLIGDTYTKGSSRKVVKAQN